MKSMKAARLTEEAEVKEFIDRLLQASRAAQTEVMVTEWDSALTRFANNGIHQNVAERDVSVRVRVVKDGKTGVATINQMNEENKASRRSFFTCTERMSNGCVSRSGSKDE